MNRQIFLIEFEKMRKKERKKYIFKCEKKKKKGKNKRRIFLNGK